MHPGQQTLTLRGRTRLAVGIAADVLMFSRYFDQILTPWLSSRWPFEGTHPLSRYHHCPWIFAFLPHRTVFRPSHLVSHMYAQQYAPTIMPRKPLWLARSHTNWTRVGQPLFAPPVTRKNVTEAGLNMNKATDSNDIYFVLKSNLRVHVSPWTSTYCRTWAQAS